MQKLNVFIDKVLVGELNHHPMTKSFDFKYDKNWINNGFELSPALKFSGFEDFAFKLFIENLLPEGSGLDDIALYYQISKSDKFAVLKKIGAETTGALTFSEDDSANVSTSFREIPFDELAKRLERKEVESINVWDDKLRLSVAGVQEKLPLAIIDGVMGFGEGDICSTHILKFNKKSENVILNEYISLKLCKTIGMNVVEVEYKQIGSENVLFVERFDREIVSSTMIKRLHIIDSVQALGFPSTFKYERAFDLEDSRAGVSFEKLFNLASYAQVPILFKEQLIQWSMINLMLGNSDAHGKNISFFVHKNGLEVAPFYDIVNVTMYKSKYKQDMAMAIDDEFIFEEISIFNMLEFLEQNNISKVQYFNDFKKLTKKIQANINFEFIEEPLRAKEVGFISEYRINLIDRINRLIEVVNGTRYPVPNKDESLEEFYDDFEDIILSRVKKSRLAKAVIVEKYLLTVKNNLIEKLK